MQGTIIHEYCRPDFVLQIEMPFSAKPSIMVCLLIFVILILGPQQGWSDDRVRFSMSFLLSFRGQKATPAKRDYYRKQFNMAVKELSEIKISATTLTKKGGKIFKAFRQLPLIEFGEMQLQTGQAYVVLPPTVIDALSKYHQLFPLWTGKIKNTRGLILVGLVFYRLRMSRTPGVAVIKNLDILAHLGLPIEKQDVPGRNYARIMIKSVLDAVQAVGFAAQHHLAIIPEYGEGIDNFLYGKTRFEATEAAVVEYYRKTSINHAPPRRPAKSINKIGFKQNPSSAP